MALACFKPLLVGMIAKWSVTFWSSKIRLPTLDTSKDRWRSTHLNQLKPLQRLRCQPFQQRNGSNRSQSNLSMKNKPLIYWTQPWRIVKHHDLGTCTSSHTFIVHIWISELKRWINPKVFFRNEKGMDHTTAAKDPFGPACSACACSISRASFLWSLGKNLESVRLSSGGVNKQTERHPVSVSKLCADMWSFQIRRASVPWAFDEGNKRNFKEIVGNFKWSLHTAECCQLQGLPMEINDWLRSLHIGASGLASSWTTFRGHDTETVPLHVVML